PMRAKFLLAVLVVAVAALVAVPVASPAGAGAVSFTQNWHNVTETSTDVNPCSGAPGTLTLTYNAIFHVTTLENGTYWATFTQTASSLPFPQTLLSVAARRPRERNVGADALEPEKRQLDPPREGHDLLALAVHVVGEEEQNADLFVGRQRRRCDPLALPGVDD